MADYKTKRIQNLKNYIIETYNLLPKECKKMSVHKFSDFLSDKCEELLSRSQKFSGKDKSNNYAEETKKVIPRYMEFAWIREYINALVDIGELNFDESLPLKGIVKIIKENKG